ncbi:MAG: NUDIX hydrolase [Gammaproteobacteria bacterium]|nr:NUDIX hydrolase [Gammaproteobacteria bacterium]
MVWKPRLTVAAVVERDARFLMVEERIEGRLTLNQPAGHVEDGESILSAVERETWEETAWRFRPDSLIGIYRWVHPGGDTFLRVAISGGVFEHDPDQALDPDIESARWVAQDELQTASDDVFRSPLVMRCIEDYRQGFRYPLALLQDVE